MSAHVTKSPFGALHINSLSLLQFTVSPLLILPLFPPLLSHSHVFCLSLVAETCTPNAWGHVRPACLPTIGISLRLHTRSARRLALISAAYPLLSNNTARRTYTLTLYERSSSNWDWLCLKLHSLHYIVLYLVYGCLYSNITSNQMEAFCTKPAPEHLSLKDNALKFKKFSNKLANIRLT